MNIIKKLISFNYTKNNSNRKIDYIVIHYTAGTTSKKGSALNTVLYTFNNPKTGGSAHYVVDNIEVVQCVEDRNTAWHCGTTGKYKHSKCRNSNSLGIEICSNHNSFKGYDLTPASDKGWYFTEDALNLSAELTANLMVKYNLSLDRVIRHYDVTGKDCPSPMVDANKNGPDNWIKFKEKVKKYYDIITIKNSVNIDFEASNQNKGGVEPVVYHALEEVPEWGKTQVKWFIDNGYLTGIGKGDLSITEDLLRVLIILYRVLNKE